MAEYDRRYPMIAPLDGRAVPTLNQWALKDAVRIGRDVGARTGTRAFYNYATGRIFWVYGDEPHGGPLGVEFRFRDGYRHYHGGDVDDFVRYINMGKMARAEKDRIAAANDAAEKHAATESQGRFSEGNRANALDYAGFLDRKRRGTGTLVTV